MLFVLPAGVGAMMVGLSCNGILLSITLHGTTLLDKTATPQDYQHQGTVRGGSGGTEYKEQK